MGLKFKDIVKAVKELELTLDPETEVCFVDEYGDTYSAESVITSKKDSRTIIVIE